MLTKALQSHGGLYSRKQVSNLFKIITTTHTTPHSTSSYASTIDKSEISHFNGMSTSWWDELGGAKGLHAMNKLRIPVIRDGLINVGAVKKEFLGTAKPLKNLSILEVGCGGGILTESLAKIGSNITGIDVSSELIELAKKHAAQNPSLTNITYRLESVEEHAKNNIEKYDAVIASEVLEHVNNQAVFLEDCVKCLKPNGSIFVTTINKTAISWLGAIVVAEYLINFVPRGTHDWGKFIAPHQTQRILEDSKCRTVLMHGMCYNFVTNSWSWTSDTSVNYALHAVKD